MNGRCSYSWLQGGTPPTQTKGKKTILCCTDNFVRGTRAADAEVEETMLNVAGTFL